MKPARTNLRGVEIVEQFAQRNPHIVELTESQTCDHCKAAKGARCTTPSGAVTWWHRKRQHKAGTVDEHDNWLYQPNNEGPAAAPRVHVGVGYVLVQFESPTVAGAFGKWMKSTDIDGGWPRFGEWYDAGGWKG